MKFKTTKFKIRHTYEKANKNSIDLNVKKNNSLILPTRNKVNQVPRTIYDSGWIQALPWDGNIVPSEVDLNASVLIKEASGYNPPYPNGTTKKNNLFPVELSYYFQQLMDIPEIFLPYIQVDILTKSYPDVEFIAGQSYDYYRWKERDYTLLKGGSKILYEGYNPPNSQTEQYTTEEINSGITTSDLVSKFFEGECSYTIGGDNYRIVGKIDRIEAYYNVYSNPTPSSYNYDYFYQCLGFTNVSGSNFTGKGTHKNVIFVEDPPTIWNPVVTITKNVTKTVPIDEDTTFMRWFGTKYKNGVRQSGSIHSFTTSGTFGGDATLTDLDVDYLQNNRIFYSSKWAYLLMVNTNTERYTNVPNTIGYQTGTLPYAHLTYQTNPNDFPEEEIASNPVFAFFDKTEKRIKLNSNNNEQQLRIAGNLYYVAPATQESLREIETVNETYSQVSSGYSRNAENRSTKNKSVYLPELFPVEVKLLVTMINPLHYKDNQKFIKET